MRGWLMSMTSMTEVMERFGTPEGAVESTTIGGYVAEKLERIPVEGDTLKFEISDEGLAFERANYKEPDIQENIRLGKKGGVGIALVNRIMDKVEFSSNGTHNTCLLYKKIK